MAHMPKSAKNTEQRAACDRCHALKNRCVRSTTDNDPCERCTRLQLGCAYSDKLPTGRPRQRQGPASSHSSPMPSSPFDEIQVQPRQERPMIDYSDVAMQTFQETQSMMGFDPTFTPVPGMDEVFDDGFDWLLFCQKQAAVDQDHSGTTRHNSIDSDPAFPFQGQSGMDDSVTKLYILQHRLRMLKPGHDATRRQESGLGEIMSAVESLTSILNDFSHARHTDFHHSTSQDSVFEHVNVDIVLLHANACYLSILQLLGPLVTALKEQGQSTESPTATDHQLRAAISVGTFNLASKPALDARMSLGMIRMLIEELHKAAQGNLQQQNDRGSPHARDGRLWGGHLGFQGISLEGESRQPSAMTTAARIATQSVQRSEACVFSSL